MERIVIVAYKPHKGKEEDLKALSKKHWAILNKLGLVSDRMPILMQAEDHTIVEVFGWKSKEAIEKAHSNPEVLSMWEAYAQICEYIPIGQVKESNDLFSEFNPVEFSE